MPTLEREIVIIGGGIIGCSTAYFLTRHPQYDPEKHKITLLEACKIAGGASGKAGGLLALWAYPSSIVPLSFRLHAELAKEHDGEERWGYRCVNAGQLIAKARSPPGANRDSISLQKRDQHSVESQTAADIPPDLDWFASPCLVHYSSMGTPSTTAQVHPYLFTTSMATLAQEAGVTVILGKATSINHSNKKVQSVTYTPIDDATPITLQATDIIVAAGPWTPSLLPSAPISSIRAHSVTIRPTRPVSPYAIFSEISHSSNPRRSSQISTPEIYARPNNECYACGAGDSVVPLPPTAADVVADPVRCQDIVDQVSSISDELRDGEVLVRQACYLPVVHGDAGPLIGKTGVQGLLLAAGHTCWGIQNAPATGKLMSEFLFEGAAKSARVEGLSPKGVI